MASPDYRSTANDDSRLTKRFPTLHVILPWKTRPAKSHERPVLRGGARNVQVKTASVDCIPLPVFPEGARVSLIDKIKRAIRLGQTIQTVEPKTLSPAELHRLYAGTSVPEHRYLSPSLAAAVSSPEIARDPAKWLSDIPKISLPRVVNAWLNTNGNTDYERLYCIGLDPDTGQLTGVLTVKHGSGYSGKPCTTGSTEYVAFWVDWGSGFQYEGTASAAVYDFGWLPRAGLEYVVSLPIDLLSKIRFCSGDAKTVKVRAVLSWNIPPSTTDPYAPVVWGNSVESRISIPLGQSGRTLDRLAAAGATAIDPATTHGKIVDAAIKALTVMPFAPYAGLTVAPESAVARTELTGRSFAIDARDIEDGDNAFTLVFSNRGNPSRGTITNLKQMPVRICPQAEN